MKYIQGFVRRHSKLVQNYSDHFNGWLGLCFMVFLLIKKIILTYLNEQPSINFKLPNSAIFKVHFLTLEVYILHIIWFLQNFCDS